MQMKLAVSIFQQSFECQNSGRLDCCLIYWGEDTKQPPPPLLLNIHAIGGGGVEFF